MRTKIVPRPLAGVAIAVALVTGACSSEPAESAGVSTETGESTVDSGQQPSSAEDQAEPEASDQSDQSDSAQSDSDQSDSGQSDSGPDDSASETPAPIDHLFPNLDTVNIVDGSTVNLAEELAGGDVPVLLWFWAPH